MYLELGGGDHFSFPFRNDVAAHIHMAHMPLNN